MRVSSVLSIRASVLITLFELHLNSECKAAEVFPIGNNPNKNTEPRNGLKVELM
jgi:hypothetical protein